MKKPTGNEKTGRTLSSERGSRLTRRRALSGAIAVGVGIAASPFTRSAFAQTPKRGGHFRLAQSQGSTTDTIDPARNENYFENLLSYSVTNMLTEIDADNGVQPAVAEGWEASKDSKRWKFRLRKGVTFHSGRSLKPADVIASMNHHRGDKSTSSAKPVMQQVSDVRADGDSNVIFELREGNPDFPYILTLFNLGIFPAADDGSLNWRSNDGVGGYVLKSFEPGVRAVLERDPNYWRNDRAYFDSAEVLTIFDSTARVNALRGGSADCIGQVDVKIVDWLARTPGVTVSETSGPLHFSFPMNTQVAPFKDNNVRLALKYATNREDLLKKILRGHGSLGNDHPINSSYKYYAADIPQRRYDLDKARFYLKKAGLSSLDLQIYTSDAAFTGAVDAATLLKEHMAPAGINLSVVRASNDTYFSDTWMVKPWSMSYWGGAPTVDSMLSMGYADGAAWNDTFFKDEQFNKLLSQARAEGDDAKRAAIYHDLQLILHDQGGAIIPLFPNNLFAATDNVNHGKLAGNWDLDGLRIIERWWFS